MTIDILMPAVGAGTTHGRIIQWLKKQGDPVSPGDVLAEIETDKAVIELEAFDEGVLDQVLIEAGEQDVAVGEVIALISDGASTPMDEASTSEPTVSSRRQSVSPAARRLAAAAGLDLAALKGSGPAGRIVRIDIERAVGSAHPGVTVAGSKDKASRGEEAQTSAQATIVSGRSPNSAMRKTIARRLVESKQQIPHFYLTVNCRMDAVQVFRDELNRKLSASSDACKLSINDIVVYAVARAMAKVPEVNVRWAEAFIEHNPTIDISVAVSTPYGLITPIVKSADCKRLGELSQELASLVARGRAGRLSPDEYEGGGLTLSNLGMYGVSAFTAIINPPQAAILAIGAIEKRPIVEGDQLVVGQLCTMTLSADHRAIDGVVGARFLAELKALLETPSFLLL